MIFHMLNNATILVLPIMYQYTNFSISTDNEFKTCILVLIVFACFVLSIVANVNYIKNNLLKNNGILS